MWIKVSSEVKSADMTDLIIDLKTINKMDIVTKKHQGKQIYLVNLEDGKGSYIEGYYTLEKAKARVEYLMSLDNLSGYEKNMLDDYQIFNVDKDERSCPIHGNDC